MDIAFARSRDRRARTVATRADGVRLAVLVFGKLDPIPHDLAHFLVEVTRGLRDGFWGSVAGEAIFGGMEVIAGRQPPHASERSRAIIAANQRALLFSELMVDVVPRAVNGERLEDEPLHIDLPMARTTADRDALVARIRPNMGAMMARWRAVPEGEHAGGGLARGGRAIASSHDAPSRRPEGTASDAHTAIRQLAQEIGATCVRGGEAGGIRTHDSRLKRPLLCH